MSNLVCRPVSGQEVATCPRPAVGEEVYIGVDVSRSKWAHCVRFGDEVRRQLSTPGELSHLQALVKEYSGSKVHVVYEACGFGFEIAWWLQEQQSDVMVIAPTRVPRAPGRRVKTDRLDARELALKRELNQLKGIYIPSRAGHEKRQLVRTYQQTLKDRRRQQTRIRAMLQEHGRLGPSPRAGWKAYLDWLETQKTRLSPGVTTSLSTLLLLRAEADRAVKRLQQAILAVGKSPDYEPIVRELVKEPGVGEFTATVLLLELGSFDRFRSGAALAHYLGVTPSEHSTGDTVRRGNILKCGPGTLRALLVQCAWRSVRRDHGDPQMRAVYERLLPDSKRAIIAVTRRLAVAIHARWKAALLVKNP